MGRSGAGKDTFAHILQRLLQNDNQSDFEIEQFVKMRMAQENPIWQIKSIWQNFLDYSLGVLGVDTPKEYQYLQGKNFFKENYFIGKQLFSKEVWASFLMQKYFKKSSTNSFPNWIVSDVKYREDYDYLKQNYPDAKFIRVVEYKPFEQWCDQFGIDIVNLPVNLQTMNFVDFMLNLTQAIEMSSVICSNERYVEIHKEYYDIEERRLDLIIEDYTIKNNGIFDMILQGRKILGNLV